METIRELAALPMDTLIERFWRILRGGYLYRASRGTDKSPLITHGEPKSTSREVTFQRDIRNWQDIAKTVAELTREVVNDMKRAGYKCKTVTVKVKFGYFETHTRAKTLKNLTNSLDEIRAAAFDCLKRFELKKKVRLIGVKVGN